MENTTGLPGHVLARPVPTADDVSLYRGYSADIAAGVAVISTLLRGRDYAATVSGFLSVSYDPPTMLVSLYAESRIAEAVTASGTWALSVLGSRHRSTADWLASPGTPVEGLLAQIPFRRGAESGAAVIDGSLAYFELRSTAVHAAATHILVVGEVLSMGTLMAGVEGMDPLVHFGSAYHRLQN
ncbi:flavin reductase [Paeniglutamicibacter antarcticus]|uniref:Flavin reductase n=1 Tax=Arthrobacter terrae TaxID=2935737 RepID=A0A931CN83_9MICC|nr:flavin reductase family protein [Arthrobacter terrae]MBG0738499.1 flavin reductase [Arthrobacter terrae]